MCVSVVLLQSIPSSQRRPRTSALTLLATTLLASMWTSADLPTDAFIRHMDSVSVARRLCCVRVMFGDRVLFMWTLSLVEIWFCWSFFLGVRLHGWCQEYSWNSKLGSSLTRKAKLCGWVQRCGSCGDIPKADHIHRGLGRRAG